MSRKFIALGSAWKFLSIRKVKIYVGVQSRSIRSQSNILKIKAANSDGYFKQQFLSYKYLS